MVLRKKAVQKVFILELWVALAILFLCLVFQDYIVTYLKPPVMDYVGTHIDFLKIVMLSVFLFCAFILILIVWLLEWGDRQKKSPVTQYISIMVCENYYGDYRKTNVYKAIKTALSKFSSEELQSEANQDGDVRHSSARYVDPKRFAIKDYPREQQAELLTEDTSDGKHLTHYKNGAVAKEFTYKNHLLHGLYRSYYEDGTLNQERTYNSGKLDGIYKAYDEFGVAYFEIIYRDGKQDGITNIYFKSGARQYQDIYKDGVRIHRNTYSESGELLFSQDETFL